LSHKTAVGLGWFLVSIGLLFLLYQLLPWEVLTPEDRAILLISSGLILLGCYFALGWVKSSLGREIIRGVNTFVTILAFLTILLSVTYFFTPLALMTQMGAEEASKTGQTSVSVGDVSKLSLNIDLVNGDVVLKGSDTSQIVIQYEITTRGLTTAAAFKNLNKTQLHVTDSKVGDVLKVKISVSGPDLNRVWSKVDLLVYIPSTLSCEITHSTLNGKLEISGISGAELSAEIANGRVEFTDAYFEKVDVSVTNGEIRGSISSQDLEYEIINGEVYLEIIDNESGKYSIDVINGDVTIDCNLGSNKGFDFDISTIHGTIDMGIEDFDLIRSEDKKSLEAKTEGYSLAQVKIKVLVDVVNGSIDIRP